ncbi:hypothetical protein DAKH74_018020 [Maudiozyma humilis]|uniref:Uncharacterized protein n=1 Tax=Maudiozyma humilis TaxID=51915 RepID=A0AAV5RUH1_MAUHU|nr:hypothetical protein DAKH74_018020 [Kazachstania humilis]
MNPLRVVLFLHLVAIPAICLSVETSHAFNLTSNATAHMFLPRSVLQDAYYEQVPFPKLPSFVSMVCSGLVQITKSVMWWLFDWVLGHLGLRRWHKCYSGPVSLDINMDDLDHVKSYMAQLDVMHYGSSCKGVNATEIEAAMLPYFQRVAKSGERPSPCYQYTYSDGTLAQCLMRLVECEYFADNNTTMCKWGTETLNDTRCPPLWR